MKKKKLKYYFKNRKASFEYEWLEEYVAGIKLEGTEIKSIRAGHVNFNNSYCLFDDYELYIKNLNIAAYEYGTYQNHDPIRDRKILLTKRELVKLKEKVQEKGLTIIPTSLFIAENGFAKLNIALAKGKKAPDKKQTILERDISRQMDRDIKNYRSE
jgi:SsrA-binding protein